MLVVEQKVQGLKWGKCMNLSKYECSEDVTEKCVWMGDQVNISVLGGSVRLSALEIVVRAVCVRV